MQPPKTIQKHRLSDERIAAFRKPFPERKRTWLDTAMALMQWTDAMTKGAYPRRNAPTPTYDSTTTVSLPVSAEELEAILATPGIAKTKKLRPRLEAVRGADRIDLSIGDWATVCLALCGATTETQGRNRLLGLAEKIAGQLAEALHIDPPVVERPGT
jgi:hypothetical protein